MEDSRLSPSLILTALLLIAIIPIGTVGAAPTEASEFYYGVEYDWNSIDTDLENLTGLNVPEILGEVMGAADDAGFNLIVGQLQTGASNVYVHHTEDISAQTIQDNNGNDVSVWSRTDDVTLRHGILADSILQTNWSETTFGADPSSFDIDIVQSLEQVLTVDMTYTEYLDDSYNLVGADMAFSMEMSAAIGLDIDALFEGGGEDFPVDFNSELTMGYSITDSTSEWRLGSPDSIYVDLSAEDEVYWDCDDCGDVVGSYTGAIEYSFSVSGIPTEDFGLDAGEFDLEISDSLTDSGTFDMEAEGGYDFQMGDTMTVDLGDGEGVTTQVQSCESCPPGNPLMFMMMGHVLVGSGTAFAEQLVEDLGDGFEDDGFEDGFSILLFPYIWASSLAEGNTEENTDGDLALYVFDADDALNGAPSEATDDNLVRVTMTQGSDINWAVISVQISVNNGAPMTCDNPGATGGSCGLVEFGDTSDQVWSVGDGVTIIETGQDLCDANETCSVTVTIADTQEGKVLDESSTEGRSMANDDVFICDNGNEIPIDWYDDRMDDCGDGSDEPNMDPEAVFTCDNGNEISIDWYDDNYDDCGDRSDEPNMPYPSDSVMTIVEAFADSGVFDVLEQFGMNLEDRLETVEPFEEFPYNDGMWAPLWSNEHAAMVGVGVYVMDDDGNYTMAGPVTQGYTDELPAKLSIRYLTGVDANAATNGMEEATNIADIVNVEEHNLDDIAEDLAAAGVDVGNLTLPQSSNSNATTGDENPTPPTAEELAEDAGLMPFLSPISMVAVIALAGVVAGSRRDEDQQVDE
jgi:hypothetical protein